MQDTTLSITLENNRYNNIVFTKDGWQVYATTGWSDTYYFVFGVKPKSKSIYQISLTVENDDWLYLNV